MIINKSNSNSLIYDSINDLTSFKIEPIIQPLSSISSDGSDGLNGSDGSNYINPLDIKIKQPSGGEKTRIDIIRTIIRAMRPNIKVVVFDEPEAGIDPTQGMDILLKVVNCKQLQGKTKLIISHMCGCQLARFQVNYHWVIQQGKLYKK